MTREAMVGALVEAIATRKRDGQGLRVGIDGRCASGKTLLAAELVAALRRRGFRDVRSGSVDDFHNPREVRYRQGEYSPVGYYEDAFNWAEVATYLESARDEVVVFEGLFLFRPEIDVFWGYRVLVNVDWATSLERALVRDTGVIGTAEAVRRKYELRYEPAWQLYIERVTPERRADAVVDNRDVTAPQLALTQGSTER